MTTKPSELHVYRFAATYDWFIASSPEDALEHWREEHDGHEEDDAPPEPIQLRDDETFELSDDGGDTSEEKTCAEWCELRGPGWLGREL